MKINNLSIGIINLSVSNILSVYEGCRKAGYNVEVIDKKNCKFKYDIIIVPGVGSFSSGMKYFNENNFSEKIKDYLTKPNALVYGICLGMQLLFKKSYEFKETKGLNLVMHAGMTLPLKAILSQFKFSKRLIDSSLARNIFKFFTNSSRVTTP